VSPRERINLIGSWLIGGFLCLSGGVLFVYVLVQIVLSLFDSGMGRDWVGLLRLAGLGGMLVWFSASLIVRHTTVVVRGARERRLKGCCRSCGYSLVGNVSGICPECGELMAAKLLESAAAHLQAAWTNESERIKRSGVNE
jgi:hypothetical protein